MTTQASRREFFRRSSALAMMGSGAGWALNLASIGEAAAATATDYKAMVCIFLYGGNDYANTLVPFDSTSYAAYQSLRPSLAYQQNELTATVLNPSVALSDPTRQYALAPELAPLLPIFNAGKMAVLLNVGTLVQPTTRAQYLAASVPLPPKLFSHNDQQSYWQSSAPEGSTSGWGGRIGDLFQAGNGNTTFTCVNVSGNAVFASGKSAVQYQVTSNGSVPIRSISTPLFGSQACSDQLKAMITAPRTHLMENALNTVVSRSITANTQLTSALPTGTVTTPFDATNPLAAQLKMVARMIASSAAVGARRQVFFVSFGGFDNHSSLNALHPGLLTTVANAMAAFHQATVDLNVANQVTTFTASDFGRTLTSNGDGSDHGWGSMHFVTGGAVQGGRYYGAAPVVATNGPDDVGQGRLVPTIAVDQLSATLSNWFGVTSGQLATVVPNAGNYNAGSLNLGFV